MRVSRLSIPRYSRWLKKISESCGSDGRFMPARHINNNYRINHKSLFVSCLLVMISRDSPKKIERGVASYAQVAY